MSLGWLVLQAIVGALVVLLVGALVVEIVVGVNCIRLIEASWLGRGNAVEGPNLGDVRRARRGAVALREHSTDGVRSAPASEAVSGRRSS